MCQPNQEHSPFHTCPCEYPAFNDPRTACIILLAGAAVLFYYFCKRRKR